MHTWFFQAKITGCSSIGEECIEGRAAVLYVLYTWFNLNGQMSSVRPVAFIFSFPLEWLRNVPALERARIVKITVIFFPFSFYFLSFPSPSFSSQHTKPESVVEFTSRANFRDGLLTKKHILQFGAILVFLTHFFCMFLTLSSLLLIPLFPTDCSVCLHGLIFGHSSVTVHWARNKGPIQNQDYQKIHWHVFKHVENTKTPIIPPIVVNLISK